MNKKVLRASSLNFLVSISLTEEVLEMSGQTGSPKTGKQTKKKKKTTKK